MSINRCSLNSITLLWIAHLLSEQLSTPPHPPSWNSHLAHSTVNGITDKTKEFPVFCSSADFWAPVFKSRWVKSYWQSREESHNQEEEYRLLEGPPLSQSLCLPITHQDNKTTTLQGLSVAASSSLSSWLVTTFSCCGPAACCQVSTEHHSRSQCGHQTPAKETTCSQIVEGQQCGSAADLQMQIPRANLPLFHVFWYWVMLLPAVFFFRTTYGFI